MKNYNSKLKNTSGLLLKFLVLNTIIILSTFNSFAQFPPAPPLVFHYPYTDSFDTYLTTDPIPFQSIWSGCDNGLGAYDQHGINNSISLSINFTPTIINDSIYGSFGPLNANSQLSFSYRFVEYAGTTVTNSYSLSNDDYISIDFMSYPDSILSNIAIINSSNHIESTNFQQAIFPLIALNGDSGFLYIKFHGVDSNDHWIDLDDLKIANGNTVTDIQTELKKENNYKVFIDGNQQINITNTNYSITKERTVFSIYDLNGQLLSADVLSEKQSINASNWAAGMYIIRMQNDSGTYSQKIIL